METLFLVILFWTPILSGIIFSFFWDTQYWLINNFKYENFINHLRWDRESSSRGDLSLILKYLLFAGLSSFLLFGAFAIFFLFILYIIYVINFFNILKKIIFKDFIFKNFKNFRYVSLNILFILVITGSLTVFTQIFFNNFPISDIINTDPSLVDQGNLVFYDIYIYLIIGSIFMLFLDLAMPLVVFLFVLATSPLYLISLRIQSFFLKLNSVYKRNINILVIDQQNSTNLSEYLSKVLNILGEEFNLFEYNGENIYEIIELMKNSKIYKYNIFSFTGNNLSELILLKNLVNFDIILTTGFLTNLSNKDREVFKISKLLKRDGVIILDSSIKSRINYDKTFGTKYLKYSDFTKIKPNSTGNIFYTFRKNNKSKYYRVQIRFNDYNIDYKSVNIYDSDFIKYEVITISTINILDLHNRYLDRQTEISNINTKEAYWIVKQGDNNSKIIFSKRKEPSLQRIVNGVNYVQNFLEYSNIILVTNGIKTKNKIFLYKKLVDKLEGKIEYLFTNDPTLYQICKKETSKFNSIKVESMDSLLFNLRKLQKPGSVIIIETLYQKDLLDKLTGI